MTETGERAADEAVWRFLLALRSAARRVRPTDGGPSTGAPMAEQLAWSSGFSRDGEGGWRDHGRRLPSDTADLLDLYLPVCIARPVVVGHLGQSLDGRIATGSGLSRYVTGPANILHLHRMRGLADAVLIGAETARQDDPQLTARLVPADNPVRVVVDPRRRLEPDRRVFIDGAAPTLLVCEERHAGAPPPTAHVEVLGVPSRDGRLDLAALCQALSARGLQALFVEGGGVTVSRFLECGLLDRLQIAVAPVILGSGRPGLTLPPIETLDAALRPRTRVFQMGEDVLFDCDLRA